ncbi:hypothetical protein [Suttonella ornithocola]|uniref:Uncharacterized protein n=1 Tax=Suttonella ornithocola TaxID=279832 RepID=A0A380N080_9GAMM|nr:hypothetical protein [Suttonella ornithocola]SUO97894.1 Uncharacterised protein [Suttonella ornithocola]
MIALYLAKQGDERFKRIIVESPSNDAVSDDVPYERPKSSGSQQPFHTKDQPIHSEDSQKDFIKTVAIIGGAVLAALGVLLMLFRE